MELATIELRGASTDAIEYIIWLTLKPYGYKRMTRHSYLQKHIDSLYPIIRRELYQNRVI